jgi:hypothetical protein
MKDNVVLTITSLLSIVFTMLHLVDDIVRGMAAGGIVNLPVVLVLVVWLYGTLVLAGRRSGYIIVLILSLLAAGLPIIHMMGSGGMVGGAIARTSGAFFFAWNLLMLETTAIFSAILAARGLRTTTRA